MGKLFSLLLILSVSSLAWSQDQLAKNKEIVVAFYETAFNKHKPREAMSKYVGDKYIQHNPFVADGKQPFVDFFEPHFLKNKEAHVLIKRVIAEGDLVVLHVNSKSNKKDLGRAVVDIFRLENGKIVEHWDVAQPVPEKLQHQNTMF